MAVQYRTFTKLFAMDVNESERKLVFPPGAEGKIVSLVVQCVNKNSLTLLGSHRGVIVIISDAVLVPTGTALPGEKGHVATITLGIVAGFLDGVNYVAAHQNRSVITWSVGRAPLWPERPQILLVKDNTNQEEVFSVELVLRFEDVSDLERTQAAYGALTR